MKKSHCATFVAGKHSDCISSGAVIRGINVVPSGNVAVQLGSNVTFQCSTDSYVLVRWQKLNEQSVSTIFDGNIIWPDFRPRFNVASANRSLYVSKLFISSVTLDDAGFYACMVVDGQGVQHVAELVVCT